MRGHPGFACHFQPTSTDEIHAMNVLFLCTGNSARSILAEAYLNLAGKGRFSAFSAGSKPGGRVNPYALELLQKNRISVEGLRSKSWDEFAAPGAPQMDIVLTVCDSAAAEACPYWPGQPMTAHWGMPDPAAAEGSPAEIAVAFADTYRMLTNRLSAFANLKISGLDRMSLQNKLSDIRNI